MTTKYYPVFLDLAERTAVVVGGGTIAEGKVHGLLEAGARVVVISPAATEAIRALAEDDAIRHEPRPYAPGDLAGAWLAIAATDDQAVNMAVAEEAARLRILVNVVDRPAQCTFIAPAVVRRGDLTLAISTNGKSPAMARYIREEIERLFPPEYGALLTLVAGVRSSLRSRGLTAPPDLWQEALSMDLLSLLRRGQAAEAAATLDRTLTAGSVLESTVRGTPTRTPRRRAPVLPAAAQTSTISSAKTRRRKLTKKA